MAPMAIKIAKSQEFQNLHKLIQPLGNKGRQSLVLGKYDPNVLVVL